MKVAGRWVYLYRAIDQFGQVIDVLVSQKRDLVATRRIFTRALERGLRPSEVTTDRAPAYPRVLDELLLPSACHVIEQYTNNPIEPDHGRLKAKLRPMRGLKRLRSTRVISTGHAFIQNLRRGPTNSALTNRWPCGWWALRRADPSDLTTRRSTDLACLGFTECNNATGSARPECSRGSGGFTRLNLKAGYCTG